MVVDRGSTIYPEGKTWPAAGASAADVEALKDRFEKYVAATSDIIVEMQAAMDEMENELDAFRAQTNGKSGPIGRIEALEAEVKELRAKR